MEPRSSVDMLEQRTNRVAYLYTDYAYPSIVGCFKVIWLRFKPRTCHCETGILTATHLFQSYLYHKNSQWESSPDINVPGKIKRIPCALVVVTLSDLITLRR
jgi:hypothetical protein